MSSAYQCEHSIITDNRKKLPTFSPKMCNALTLVKAEYAMLVLNN
jgi:hypothetical protein